MQVTTTSASILAVEMIHSLPVNLTGGRRKAQEETMVLNGQSQSVDTNMKLQTGRLNLMLR